MSSTPLGARVRIGDTERDAAAAALGEHFAAGRLTREEFDERLEQAWAAKTAEEINPLFVDLPRAADHPGTMTLGHGDPVGFMHRAHQQRSGLRRRSPFGLPPPLAFVLMIALVVTIISHLPIILFVLGCLWFTGMIGHRHRHHRGHWASSR